MKTSWAKLIGDWTRGALFAWWLNGGREARLWLGGPRKVICGLGKDGG
jgi:hypothetical protein